MAVSRRSGAAAGGVRSTSHIEGSADEGEIMTRGGGAATTPQSRLTHSPPRTPLKKNGTSKAPPADAEKPHKSFPTVPVASSPSRGLTTAISLLFLALAVTVLYLTLPAIQDLRQIVQTHGVSEKKVRAIVKEAVESHSTAQARKPRTSQESHKENVPRQGGSES
ncbi:hypothetical protein NSK_002037 [Nannochloropsis salina CCMP1776]|uniref:Uncharacterized protein n=1 Tax=Nannochloropsis salina CCMP1776 TaxID=1027361 RepID=A0A4D9D669_9STRA|nr:hypothetical protein NSK_002037 [Nannochloropsis salina CCMP1776]|eukprot:TFJ86950.1 hypothetical protein NSK_002037 [Nannochloropsis salina CCMP1776]